MVEKLKKFAWHLFLKWVHEKPEKPPVESKPTIKITSPEMGDTTKPWYIVLGAAFLAAAVFCFIKFPVITVLVLAVLLLAAAYIGYKKKCKYYYVFLIAAFALILAAGIFTNSPALTKALFGGAMGAVAALSLIVDNFHKKIKELKERR
jgi:hypothetical protein